MKKKKKESSVVIAYAAMTGMLRRFAIGFLKIYCCAMMLYKSKHLEFGLEKSAHIDQSTVNMDVAAMRASLIFTHYDLNESVLPLRCSLILSLQAGRDDHKLLMFPAQTNLQV